MQLQVGVKVLLQNSEGKYLLLRRALDTEQPIQGKWDIPGGRIDPGTPLMQNLAREVMEETQLEIVGTPRLVAAQDIIPNADRHIVRLTYVGHADGEPVLSHEHTDWKWCSFDEMKTLDNLDSYFKQLLDDGAFDTMS